MEKTNIFTPAEIEAIKTATAEKIAYYRTNPIAFREMMKAKMETLYGEAAKAETKARYVATEEKRTV
jgi:hypothetical protein